MPAEVGHDRQKWLYVKKPHAILVIRLPVPSKFVRTQSAHTRGMPFLELGRIKLGAAHGDTAQAVRLPPESVQHRAIIAAVGARLHQHASLEAETIKQREVSFERGVFGGVAARFRVRKPRRRTKDVTMTVAGAPRQGGLHRGLMPASLAASFICAKSLRMKAANPFDV